MKDAALEAVERVLAARKALDELPVNVATRRARKHLARATVALLPLLSEVS
jgi:hypothetical protein